MRVGTSALLLVAMRYTLFAIFIPIKIYWIELTMFSYREIMFNRESHWFPWIPGAAVTGETDHGSPSKFLEASDRCCHTVAKSIRDYH